MAADKITAFYDDPVKVAADERAMRASIYARRITTETGLEWRLRRLRNNTARRLMIFARRFREAGNPSGAALGVTGAAFDHTDKAAQELHAGPRLGA
jgi:hypothetical protein